ncbi:MAG: glutaredoxin 3 [Oceanicaulis sp.]|uniref:glutaredoxin 3 n=1 Tax=Glycocaulis sp. TaxID=1969725 RepID=UPI0025BB62D8|nr:glutaredoxin 3 [Glycocaulis sp.]MCC5980381.1 glutaredoxin 3 [Oceanicaulis sp.]MCH8520319.1 glutaredoxin 3 [Glycocaulis sp.]
MTTPAITIYTRPFCPYCTRAVALLKEKGAAFEEVEAGFDPALRAEMQARSGRNTFPQIFIGEMHVGGCDDLFALDHEGLLDPMLAGAA